MLGQPLWESRSTARQEKTRRHRRRSRRTSDRHERRSCIEVDERKKRPRACGESRYSNSIHLQLRTCHVFYAITPSARACHSSTAWHTALFNCSLSTCRSLRLKSRAASVHRQFLTSDATLEERSHGGYASVRVGDVQNPGPAPHVQKNAALAKHQRTRINEAGDAVPGSQDSITRGVQNLQLTDTPATQTTLIDPAPPPMPNSRRLTQPRSRRQRHYFRCGQCGADPEVYTGNSDRGLTMHMVQKHCGQHLSK